MNKADSLKAPICPQVRSTNKAMARHVVLVCPVDPARREITKSPAARMRYNVHDFWANVVRRLGYKLVGWPESIPFTNLSNLKGGRRPIEELLHLWNNGTLTFVPINSPAEVTALKPRTIRQRAARRDLKSHRKQLTASGRPRRCHHRGAITPLTVSEDIDEYLDMDLGAGRRRFACGELAEDPIEEA
ncbi:hypothetical protein EVJ58_g10537 [Rhodofomes roseus]|uniref:Uncharacterized protein n=1 Tax=Rhodofomes roseus TaxID=34475 RepID=A0A4Y9XN27_9APHY|nr:hypothetical protein EVJ58_g10537 [Rhodofomes roseus]